MSLIETKTGRKYFRKTESMMLVPYVYDDSDEVNDYVLGSDVYDISAVIGDSIALEQDDGDVEEKFNEFKRTPIVRNVSAGSYDFTAQCLDLQDKILKSLFGAYTASGATGVVQGVVAMPDDYQLQYAMIRIRFKDASLSDIVLPKVQMNSNLLLQQMKSRGSQGNVSGTALSRMVAVVDENSVLPMVLQFGSSAVGENVFAPSTPVLFIPRGYRAMILHHYDEDNKRYVFSTVNFSTGSVAHNTVVNIEDGSYETLS